MASLATYSLFTLSSIYSNLILSSFSCFLIEDGDLSRFEILN